MTVSKITSPPNAQEAINKINEIIDNLGGGGGGSVDIDNLTITENSSNEIQTVAVIDNNTGNAIKTWTGTIAQEEAVTVKDSNTLYYTPETTSVGDIVTDLNGKADTDLTNCSVPVVVSRTPNNQGGIVEIWSDGYCIQTGFQAAPGGDTTYTINLSQSYKDTNYYVDRTPQACKADANIQYIFGIVNGSKTVNSFQVLSSFTTYYDGFWWRTEGYIS